MAITSVYPPELQLVASGASPAPRRETPPQRVCRRLELHSLSVSRETRVDGQVRRAAPLAELRFRWPHADGSVASLQSIEIHDLPREALHRLRVDAGPCTVEDLTSLSDGRGRWIPAGELLWAMAVTHDTDWRGRLTLPLSRADVTLHDLQVTLWVSQVSARPSVDLALVASDEVRPLEPGRA